MYLFFLLTLLAFFQCEKRNPLEDAPRIHPHRSPETINMLKKRKLWLEARQGQDYQIANMSNTKEDAILHFLEAIRQDRQTEVDRWIFNKKEYTEMLWPNFPEEKTLDPGMDPESLWKLLTVKRGMGYLDIKRAFKRNGNGDFILDRIDWRGDDVRDYGPFTIHILDALYVKMGGRLIRLEQIKFVIEYKGKFKVAYVTTG